MSEIILGLTEIDKTMPGLVGGKGANLSELTRIDGIMVPDGFCISTEAFKRIIGENPVLDELLDHLSLLKVDDCERIRELSSKIRNVIEGTPMPREINEEVSRFLSRLGETNAYAVRSSATAEDLPTASFAGQQDTYLNIIGKESVLQHISKCWASLFTDRAVIYRIQNGFGHHKTSLSVIVQKMVFPAAAGISFTADPLTSNRKIVSIDASFGIGEAMVSGLVNADNYKVRNGTIINKKISTKKLAIHAATNGGTIERELEPVMKNRQALTDEQILELERIARKIEAHFGRPQDIEWCLADNTFYVVQSRPITTLFPVPHANDQENHVYISVGHQQMMTDAMKPLGHSLWKLTAAAPMYEAGGRLFVDVAPMLASPSGRHTILNVLGKFDPLIKDALTSILERGDFIRQVPGDNQEQGAGKSNGGHPSTNYEALKDYDPSIVSDLIRRCEISLAELKVNIRSKSGSELLDFILEDQQELRKSVVDPETFGVIMTAMNAAAWINEKLQEWLGEKNPADKLSQSLPNNVTSEMGLALLDLADVIRPHPEVIRYLQDAKEENFLNDLPKIKGGEETQQAIQAFLNKYGMRCAGEIDITRPRWVEKPGTLVPLLLANIKNFEPGESRRRFQQGLQEALQTEQQLLERLKALPGGDQKAAETKRMIDLVRNLAGFREYPKYSIISRYFLYKQALLQEAGRWVEAGVLHKKEDIYYLIFEELRELVRSNTLDYAIICKRKDDFKMYEKLTPPRVMTSDGEIITGRYYRENLPAGALAGLAVSSGVIEGRARVILNMEEADLEDGDILVTAFTDPSWTPLFVSIKGLVTEVGGLMTHGAVIAREYGLAAVVGVEHATRLIKDKQKIRVNGTDGYIEIISADV